MTETATKTELEKLSLREDNNFKLLLSMLQEIRDEIHKTNSQISEFEATHELSLLKMKTEIFSIVFDRLVDRQEFNKQNSSVDIHIEKINTKLETKVDKSSAKLIWFTLTAVVGTITSLIAFKGVLG